MKKNDSKVCSIHVQQNVLYGLMSRFMFLILVLLPFGYSQALAQEIPPAKVVVEGAADQKTSDLFQTKIDVLLKASAGLLRDNVDAFPADPGSASLKNLVKSYLLKPNYQELNVRLVSTSAQMIEAHRVYMKASAGGLLGLQEVVLTFSKTGILQNARMAPVEHTQDWMLSSGLFVGDTDRERVEAAVQQFAAVFMKKDIKTLGSLFAKDAVVISANLNKATNRTEYSRLDLDAFLKRTRERTFASRDDIELRFENIEVMAHPEKQNHFGVIAKQSLTTSRFSDVGNVFFSIDVSGKTPVFHVRQWQEADFPDVSIPVESLPAKRKFYSWLNEVRETEVSKKLPITEGVLKINLSSNNTEQNFNANNVAGWFKTELLSISGIEIFVDEIDVLDNTTLVFPYTAQMEEFTQQRRVQLTFKGAPSIDAFTKDFAVFPARETEITLYLADPNQSPPKKKDAEVFGRAALVSNVREAEVMVFDKSGNRVAARIGDETNRIFIDLLEGDYKFEVAKTGHEKVEKEVFVYRDGTSRVEAILPRIAVQPLAFKKDKTKPKKETKLPETAVRPPDQKMQDKTPATDSTAAIAQTEQAEKSKPTVKPSDDEEEEAPLEGTVVKEKNRFRYWIYGGTAVLVGTVVILNSGSNPTPGIPTPPARPTGL